METLMMLAIVVLVSVAVANVASATVVQGINIDFATISNPSNPGNIRGAANPSGIGAVDYTSQPGKYEITNEVI